MAAIGWEADIRINFVFRLILGREEAVCFRIDERSKRTVGTRPNCCRACLALAHLVDSELGLKQGNAALLKKN
jgi:hypothetical protein